MTEDVETRKHPMGKSRFALYYIAFCVAVLTVWQIIGGICVEYATLSVRTYYVAGNSELYLMWSWTMLIIWIIGSIIIWHLACKSEK